MVEVDVSCVGFCSDRFLRWIMRYAQVEHRRGFDRGAERAIHSKHLELLFDQGRSDWYAILMTNCVLRALSSGKVLPSCSK